MYGFECMDLKQLQLATELTAAVRTLPQVDTTKNAFFYFANNDYLADHLMVNSNMSNMPEGQADRETVFMASNRARTVRMFDNPHHSDQLREWGLRKETAFACGFRFLFREKPAVNAMFQPEFEQLARHSEALKIGINIRVSRLSCSHESRSASAVPAA